VLVEINCETDFVARTADFQQIAKDVAMQVAASKPLYVRREDVPADVLAKEQEIYAAQARQSGKPEKVIERMVAGMVEKYYADFCLLDQPYIKDPDKKVKDYLTDAIARIRENITVRRFTRYALGEGLEKRADNFAEEVAAQAAKYAQS
jgi:elongation factor Ts